MSLLTIPLTALQPKFYSNWNLHHLYFFQPIHNFFFGLSFFFSLHYKKYSVSFYAAFGRKAFQYVALGSQCFHRFESASYAVASIGIERHNGFSA